MSAGDIDYTIDEIARAWFVKMRGEDAPRLRHEFETWLATSPDHRTSYDRIARAMEQATILKTSSRYGSGRREAGSPSRRRWLPVGASIAAVVLLVAIGTNIGLPAARMLAFDVRRP